LKRKGFFKNQKTKLNNDDKAAVCNLANRLASFSLPFAKYFKSSTKSMHTIANQFLQGLILSSASNCVDMSLVVKDSHNQSLNHFLSDSVWKWQAVMDALSKRCFQHFASFKDPVALLIDESSIPKKGKHSVGVAHQYCGQTGKQDNCQVGVFGALCSGNLVSIIQSKIYLPKEWISNKARSKKAAIPENEQYKTKIELAEEIIFHVWKKLKLKFSFVSFDAFYGRDLALLQSLCKEGITFMADIAENQSIYLSSFNIEIPGKKPGRGRTPKHAKPCATKISVREYEKGLKKRDYKKITVRKGTKGNIRASFHKRTVWLFNAENKTRSCFTLLIRKDDDGTIRYSLTNSRKHLPTLAFMQGQRYFVERAFQDAKQQVGLNEYQVRGYSAWHRHITMSMMAMQFITEEKSRQKEVGKYFTSADIVKLLIFILPSKPINLLELTLRIKNKNKAYEPLVKLRKAG